MSVKAKEKSMCYIYTQRADLNTYAKVVDDIQVIIANRFTVNRFLLPYNRFPAETVSFSFALHSLVEPV